MIDQVRSEWVKLRSVRSNLVLVVFAVLIGVGISALATATVVADVASTVGPDGAAGVLVAGLPISLLLAAVLAVQVTGQEFRFRTLRTTFVAQPNRWKVLVAKWLVVVVLSQVLFAIVLAVTWVIDGAILAARGVPWTLSDLNAGRMVWAYWLLGIGYVTMGFAIGMLVRNAVGAIVLVLLTPTLIEGVISMIRPSWERWLPFDSGRLLLQEVTTSDSWSPWGGYAYFLTVGFVLCVAGVVLITRRDA